MFCIDYRLAPEHRFPAAANDVHAGWDWLCTERGLRPDRIVMAGDSAGGHLAVELLLVAVVWYTIITTILSIAQYYIERYYARGTVRVLPPTPLQRARHWVSIQWARLGDGEKTPAASATPTATTTTTGAQS